MAELTLISTLYSFQPIVASVTALSPSKIVLVVAEESMEKDVVKKDLEKVKQTYGGIAELKIVKVKGADLLSIAKKTVELLEAEKNDVVVNVSGGWKLLAQGVLYGCYAYPELVKRIVCNDIETGKLVELPKLSYGLTKSKRELLEVISKRNGKSISEIAEKMGKTRGMLYQHLKELKDMGYVDDKFFITDAGRLALL
ncbi:CRISPR locus-related DNA-binding protein [Candidatus Micrarchaeota archaeon]|nr:CRISPR locus-related DNA-binding protein [Candidatus Micrarchaeota archaeon]